MAPIPISPMRIGWRNRDNLFKVGGAERDLSRIEYDTE
jgi:hypothetical protein